MTGRIGEFSARWDCVDAARLSNAIRNCPLILPQMIMLPKRTLVSPESAAASSSKPLAKRALQSAVASQIIPGGFADRYLTADFLIGRTNTPIGKPLSEQRHPKHRT